MSALRYCGDLRIRVTYVETLDGKPNGGYRCFVKGPDIGDDATGVSVIVGAPVCLSQPVDSPEAFDAAARASLTFAHHAGWPVESHGESNDEGWLIKRRLS